MNDEIPTRRQVDGILKYPFTKKEFKKLLENYGKWAQHQYDKSGNYRARLLGQCEGLMMAMEWNKKNKTTLKSLYRYLQKELDRTEKAYEKELNNGN